jgi:hypothetical protein
MLQNTLGYSGAIIGEKETPMTKRRYTRISITPEQDDQITDIAEVFGDDIRNMGAAPETYRQDGSLGPNINGVIALALAKLAAEARRIKQSKSE